MNTWARQSQRHPAWPKRLDAKNHSAKQTGYPGQVLRHAEYGVGCARIPWQTFEWNELGGTAQPFAPGRNIHVGDPRRGRESILPIGNRAGLTVAAQLGVALADQTERILVPAEPKMHPVLFDSPRWTSARGSLASKPPSLLVDSDLVLAAMLGSRQFECCRNGSHPAPNDSNPDWAGSTQELGSLNLRDPCAAVGSADQGSGGRGTFRQVLRGPTAYATDHSIATDSITADKCYGYDTAQSRRCVGQLGEE